ncbi:MAG: LPS-assembly protein LptD [SAR86 cluster bacterium]|nr:LPS-assembly protein LptD [SAR86 cluster bacterium]MDA0899790.1 hypothetical protein [Pseudomonadota bacterium]
MIGGLLYSECNKSDSESSISVDSGNLTTDSGISINFKAAQIKENIYTLNNVEFNTCDASSVWKISAKDAKYDQEDSELKIKDARVEVFDVPIFWAGNIEIGENESINVPNLGITDSEFDLSYKFVTKSDKSKLEIEPIYTNSKFGLSFDYKFSGEGTNSRLQTFLIDDDDSSWVYRLNSKINITEKLHAYVDYSDFSGTSLIQNYGYKFLNIKRRALDLKQNFGLSLLTNKRLFETGRESFKNLSLPRPVTHEKDFFRYKSLYKFGQWDAIRESEYSKFTIKHNVVLLKKILPPADGADFPYLVKERVDRKKRNISLTNATQMRSGTLNTTVEGYWNEYTTHYQSLKEDQQYASYVIRQMVELPQSQIKFGYIFSSFDNQHQNPLLDSYPKKPSPESNISTRLWIGGDRNANQRKIFIYKSGQLGSTSYSLSTNLYEDYNFDGEGTILNNYFNNKPLYFSLQHPIGNLDLAIKGNYSFERNEFMAADFVLSYLGDNTLVSLEKKQLLIPSYPLNELDNYLLKFKRDFSNFSLFGRTQYSIEEQTINENIFGMEWKQNCFKLRLAFERARFFPYTNPDYSNGNYLEQIYLTNPIVKNNLTFEFELVGLTETLKPIERLIQNGIFN